MTHRRNSFGGLNHFPPQRRRTLASSRSCPPSSPGLNKLETRFHPLISIGEDRPRDDFRILKLLLFYFSFWVEDKPWLNKHGRPAADGGSTNLCGALRRRGIPRKGETLSSWLTQSPGNFLILRVTRNVTAGRRQEGKQNEIDVSHD